MNVEEKTKNIQELKKLLYWYIDCASNEQFDADVVISLLHQLDKLEPISLEPRECVEEFIANFWEYCKQRENEEKILHRFSECSMNLQTKHYESETIFTIFSLTH